jgi:hypothetical protein
MRLMVVGYNDLPRSLKGYLCYWRKQLGATIGSTSFAANETQQRARNKPGSILYFGLNHSFVESLNW